MTPTTTGSVCERACRRRAPHMARGSCRSGEGSVTRKRLRLAVLVRKVLLPPVLAGVAVACLLGALAMTAANGSLASNRDPLGHITKQTSDHERFASALSLDLEGTPAPSDVRSVRR